MRIYSLTPKDKKTTGNTKSYIEIKTASGCVHSATEAQVFTKELGTCLCVKLVKIYPSVLCSGRLCDELEKPKSTKGNKTVQCCTENIVPLVAVMKQSAIPSMETLQVSTYPSRKTLCWRKKWRNSTEVARAVLGESESDDQVQVPKTPAAKSDAGQLPPPFSAENRCGRRALWLL